MSDICSIEGCTDPIKTKRGYCSAHYQRWLLYGTPLGGGPRRAPQGEAHRYLEEVVLAYDGDECLTWPFGKTSEGYAKINARQYGTDRVSRIVCAKVHGPAPTPEHEAAHSCGKGHLACVTKRHFDWKTPLANTADQLTHGTRRRGERHYAAKISEDQARQIIALKGKEKQALTAARFDVSRELVGRIQRREIWAWLDAA
ncbi:MAG: hypothetical protein E5V63_04330 [Mesorhizobium sp.]|nr:MAG: hypothetical protein E5V63_04330 [Mesorhizobium sp.]